MAVFYSIVCGCGVFFLIDVLYVLGQKYPEKMAWFYTYLIIAIFIGGVSSMFYSLVFN